MSNEINVGTFERLVRRLLSMKGAGVMPVIAPELLPVLVLENDRPEWAFLAGTRIVCGETIATAVAGQRSKTQIFNPADSGIMVVITRIHQLESLSYFVTFTAVALTTLDTEARPRDRRWLLGTTGAEMRNETSVGIPAGNRVWRARADTDFIEPIVLAPGTGVYTEPNVDNQSWQTSFSWYERPLASSELTR